MSKKSLFALLIIGGACNYIQPYNGSGLFQRVEVEAPVEELNTAIDENDFEKAIALLANYGSSFSDKDINTALERAVTKFSLSYYSPEFLILLVTKGGVFDDQTEEAQTMRRLLSFNKKMEPKKVERVESLLALLKKASEETDSSKKAHLLYKAVNIGTPILSSSYDSFGNSAVNLVLSPESYKISNALKDQIYETFFIKEDISPDIYEDVSLTDEDDWEFIDRRRIKSESDAAEEDFEKELEEWEIVTGDAYRDYYNLPKKLEFD